MYREAQSPPRKIEEFLCLRGGHIKRVLNQTAIFHYLKLVVDRGSESSIKQTINRYFDNLSHINHADNTSDKRLGLSLLT